MAATRLARSPGEQGRGVENWGVGPAPVNNGAIGLGTFSPTATPSITASSIRSSRFSGNPRGCGPGFAANFERSVLGDFPTALPRARTASSQIPRVELRPSTPSSASAANKHAVGNS